MRSDTQKHVQEDYPWTVYHTCCELLRKMRNCIMHSVDVFARTLRGGVIRTEYGICILTQTL